MFWNVDLGILKYFSKTNYLKLKMQHFVVQEKMSNWYLEIQYLLTSWVLSLEYCNEVSRHFQNKRETYYEKLQYPNFTSKKINNFKNELHAVIPKIDSDIHLHFLLKKSFKQLHLSTLISLVHNPRIIYTHKPIPKSIIHTTTTIHHHFQHDQNKINTPENHNKFSSHHVYRIKCSTFLLSKT